MEQIIDIVKEHWQIVAIVVSAITGGGGFWAVLRVVPKAVYRKLFYRATLTLIGIGRRVLIARGGEGARETIQEAMLGVSDAILKNNEKSEEKKS